MGYSPTRVIPAVTFEMEVIREVEKEKIETRTVWRETKKRDGTVVKEVEKQEVEEKIVTIEKSETFYVDKPVVVEQPQKKWSLSYLQMISRTPHVSFGRHVFANAWVELQVSPKDIGVGVRLEY
jgi:hypothetical protein